MCSFTQNGQFYEFFYSCNNNSNNNNNNNNNNKLIYIASEGRNFRGNMPLRR